MFGQEPKVYSTNEIDTFPSFKEVNCQNLGSQECFKNQMDLHVTENFEYPRVALEKKLTGKAYVQFKIDSTGTISDIKARGTDKTFEQEAIRIIEQIPQINPAKLNGQSVSIRYSTPISFNLVLEGKDLSEQKELVIDMNDENSEDALKSYDEVAASPIYKGCEDSEVGAECFRSKFEKDLAKFITRKNPKTLKIEAKVYFEIMADNQISELLIISENAAIKKTIEKFFEAPSKIMSSAKNFHGKNIDCFFNIELKLMGIQRQKKIIRN